MNAASKGHDLDPDAPPEQWEALRAELEEPSRQRYTFRTGGSFILDESDRPTSVWGRGTAILSAEGEATVLAGVQGCGKSTLAQQFALGRAGFPEYAELLGLPILPGRGRVLYLAMDRPRQIARSFRRMVGDAWRAELDERLSVWAGPPPFDLARHPYTLRMLAEDAGADTVVVDSLKDAAVGLTDDEVGAGWNRARQGALAAGIELLELHHGRKGQNGVKRDRLTLDDVYGSTWITSGAGSVVVLSGEAGDPVVSLHHVKQPLDEVGPLTILHDHDAGRTTIHNPTDLAAVARARGGITALDAACVLHDTDKPTAAQREKARRKLDGLARSGVLHVITEADKATSQPTVWGAP